MGRQLREAQLLRADYSVEDIILCNPNAFSVRGNMNRICILAAKVWFRWLHWDCQLLGTLANGQAALLSLAGLSTCGTRQMLKLTTLDWLSSSMLGASATMITQSPAFIASIHSE
jgi:hypothetical protein